jgi:hypothetical protein
VLKIFAHPFGENNFGLQLVCAVVVELTEGSFEDGQTLKRQMKQFEEWPK